MIPRADEMLAVYVHWPFCLAKCPYCDFNSHVAETVDHERWRAAYLREIDHWAEAAQGRSVTSVFFGGGTPSLMAPQTTAAILERIAARWTVADDAEITLEANPTSVEAARLRDFRAAGVNRVSLGVQALDDHALTFLGRRHSAAEAMAAVRLAAKTFDRFSFDLIYGRPGQTVAAWRQELTRALADAGDHLSAYQLTIEKGTPFFAAHARGDFAIPDDDTLAALYETTQEIMQAAGMPAYEISNHARPGGESRHNLTYWRYGDYAGIGPGAHGRLSDGAVTRATMNRHAPAAWLEAIEATGSATQGEEAVTGTDRIDEIVMMGLRLAAGIDRQRFLDRAGVSLEDALKPSALARLADGGFLILDEGGLRATDAGRARLNAVMASLLG